MGQCTIDKLYRLKSLMPEMTLQNFAGINCIQPSDFWKPPESGRWMVYLLEGV